MTGYSQGVRVEHAVIAHLQEHGYDTVRAASSKGMADVIAVGSHAVLLVNCKRTRMPGPAERGDLLVIARRIPGIGIPLVALRPPRQPLEYRRLFGTGPHDWTPWTPGDAP